MKLIIDADKFKDYTTIHKADIGVDVAASCSGVVTGLSIFIPALQSIRMAEAVNAPDWILFVVGFAAFCYGIYRLTQFIRRRYSAKMLYKDVKNMDETRHRFSLVAIKDTFNTYPNRFLLRHDNDWECDLFFSFRTQDNEDKDAENIKSRLSHLLKVSRNEITVKYINETLQTKFSQKDKVTKVYDHKLYMAEISNFPDSEKKETFVTDGVVYKWRTIEEMRTDPDIQKKNMDVVDFVSANIP